MKITGLPGRNNNYGSKTCIQHSNQKTSQIYRHLTSLREIGISNISSKDLAKRMNITASQVKQDFSTFGCYGLQGYGYDVDFLHDRIGEILGLDTTRHMIIIEQEVWGTLY